MSYTASVANSTTSITVTPTVTQANATVTVNGTSVTSGTASGSISLPVGPNTITVAVTAQDGVTVRSYTVAVTRLALAPAVTTVAATGIASNAVVLQALLTAYESTSGLLFEYGTSTNSGPLPLVFAQSGIGGASPTAGNLSVTGLVPETVYYFRGVGTNVAGTGYGAFLSFRTLAINRAPVLVTPITNQSAIYDAAFSLTFPEGTFVDPDGNALTYTATGLPPGILLTSGTRTFAGAPTAVGSYSVSLVASDGQVPPLSATNNFAINVAKAQATVELSALSQTYTGAGLAATTGTTPTNLTVVVTYNGVTNLPVAAGNYTVIATVNEVNYYGSATNTLAVATKALNLTANGDSKTYGQIKTYGTGQTAFSSGSGELVNGDTVTSVTLTCADGGPATAVAGSYHIISSAAVGSGLANYSISYHDGELTVTTKALNLTASADSKTYGATKTYGTGQTAFSSGSGELINGDTVTSVTLTCADGGPATAVVGNYHIISSGAVGSGLTNYSISYHDGELTVTTKALNLTASADSKTYGATKTYGTGQTAFSSGSGELINGDTVTSVTLTCADGGPATAVVGSYHIISSAAVGSGLTNYSISYHDGELTV
ncbi:MAG: MBG domain-containing protein, partial [bacterium]